MFETPVTKLKIEKDILFPIRAQAINLLPRTYKSSRMKQKPAFDSKEVFIVCTSLFNLYITYL